MEHDDGGRCHGHSWQAGGGGGGGREGRHAEDYRPHGRVQGGAARTVGAGGHQAGVAVG